MRTSDSDSSTPFLKWPGGKRWAAAMICKIVQKYLSGTYIEPFLGGGSVFFHLRPERAILADINDDIINVYRTVRARPHLLISRLRSLPVSSRAYYEIRSDVPRSCCERAVRFLYLNRTSFAGMYRLNKCGEFNVPFGGGERTPAILWERRLIENATTALKKAALLCSDFEPILDRAKRGDVVYCDPTYTVAHDNNGFARYNDSVFAWDDQERLAEAAFRAARRGVVVIVSNAHHKSVRELYSTSSMVTTRVLRRVSCIARLPEHRTAVQEYLFVIRPSNEEGS
jgi:DNA adenine methylase